MKHRMNLLLLAVLLCGAVIICRLPGKEDGNAYSDQNDLPEMIHLNDAGGDHLFIRNVDETARMLRTLSYALGGTVGIGSEMPEDVVPQVFYSWDEASAAALFRTRRFESCHLEAWDMFKNGVFQRTAYCVFLF